MRTVEDILMKKGSDLIGAATSTTVSQAAAKMKEARCGSLIVEEDGQMVGIVTERDFLFRVLADGRDPQTTPVSAVMSSPVKTVSPADTIEQCSHTFATQHLRHLVIADNGEPVGVLSLRDILLAQHQPVA